MHFPSNNTASTYQQTAVLSSATLLLLLAVAVWQTNSNNDLFLLINHGASEFPAAIWANLTLMADTLFAVAVLLIVGVYQPRVLAQSLILLIIGGLFVHVFKQTLNWPRPPAVLEAGSFNLIGPALKSESFPSGHAFTALACAGLIVLNNIRSGFIPLVLLIGALAAISRSAVGAHWPLDVLVGGGTGLFFAWLSVKLESNIAWLQSNGIKFASVILLTAATLALAFHDSRYPQTQLLGIATSLLAVLIAIKRFWLPFLRLMSK